MWVCIYFWKKKLKWRSIRQAISALWEEAINFRVSIFWRESSASLKRTVESLIIRRGCYHHREMTGLCAHYFFSLFLSLLTKWTRDLEVAQCNYWYLLFLKTSFFCSVAGGFWFYNWIRWGVFFIINITLPRFFTVT